MTRSRKSKTPNCSVTDLIDIAVEQTVRRFLKNLVCGTWKDVFDKYEDIPSDDNDEEDYTEYDENDPDQLVKIARHVEYIDKAMELWGVMVRKRNGLSFMTMTPATKQSGNDAIRTKKPASPYIQFCKDMRPKIKSEHPDMAFGDIAKELGRRWKSLSAEEKQRYSSQDAPVDAPVGAPVNAPVGAPVDDDEETQSYRHVATISTPTVPSQGFMYSADLLGDYDEEDEEEEEDEPIPLTSTQTDRPEPREAVIVKNFIGMPQKNMTTEERKAIKRYKNLDYNALLNELDYNNVFVEESTPPTEKKRQEIINTLMNVTFFPNGVAVA